MGKRAKKICKQKSYSVARSCPEPRPTLNHPVYEAVHNRLCGNILLNDSVATLEIWKEEIEKKATVTISVFNSSMSTSFIDVTIIRNCKCPVEFTVPPGNTLSATVENAKSITVAREDAGIADGQYNLEVYFAASS
ncbi:S-Ena type endospore appendage [Priestia megaterium]|uniref:S-Ena type endospore appendage n=1 Tax=Priestia megaterium TaxID=1404 RepID=UPI003879F564